MVTFVEDFEGEVSSVSVGDWLDGVAERLWSLAERCINGKRKKRPTSTEVGCQLPSHVNDSPSPSLSLTHRYILHFWPSFNKLEIHSSPPPPL